MARRVIRTPAQWAREMTTAPRLLMALKTALAAALAWVLAPLLPLGEDQYAYYAPLGALVSMYPTIAASARSGAQAFLGLALGIGLGLVGILALGVGVPAVLALALVVCVGVLVGGIRALGVGRDWVAIAGLFVLLLSGSNADGYSLSYLLTMAFGIVVGVLVNFAIVPPLYLHRASGRLSTLRDSIAERMTSLAGRVEAGTIDAEEISRSSAELDDAIADVQDEVREADESLRGNPRGRRHRAEQEENLQRLRALERTAFYTRDLADVLAALDRVDDRSVGRDVRDDLARAIRACADLVATPVGDRRSSEHLSAADAAIEEYATALTRTTGAVTVARRSTPVAFLQRIIDASLPFVPEPR